MSLKALAIQCLTRKPDRKPSGNQEETFTPEKVSKVSSKNQEFPAENISSILSGLYRQKSESEWEWLKLSRPEWWAKRIKLENEVDGHFLAVNLEVGQETFYRLVYHLKAAPIDKLSSRIARQLDNLPANRSKP